ncbi:MAG TPA: ATP-binding protein [Aggregatilinea sp.]|uniref:GAF domain-containing sensor histidine kinase n=1 Tax=Aggregatilinea sp. TaxID=2806333 RepID=UPI002CC4E121|nr:ATP-binding protein [Aggregatilinea sp.]HML24755.1 ATP-binding protein [Aggregatilinea sp.]
MKIKVPSSFASRIAIGYALAAGLWILVSDRVVEALWASSDWLTPAQTYKGWGFVTITAILLFVLVRHEMRTLEQIQTSRDRSIQRLENLHRLDREILEARSIQHVTRTAMRHLYRTVGCDRIILGVLEVITGQWRVFPSTNSDLTVKAERLNSDPCWVGEVRGGQMKIVQDIRAEEVPGDAQCTPFLAEGMRALLYAPLMTKDRLIGVLGLAAATPSFFTPECQEIVREVASQLAIAIQQVNLTEQLEQHAHNLEANIAERQHTEVALQLSEKRLAQAQELAKIGSWTVDLETDQVSWSAEMFRLLNRDPVHSPQSPSDFITAVHPEDQQHVRNIYNRAVKSGSPVTFEFRTNGGPDSVRYFAGNIAQETNAEGRAIRLIGTLQDITALRRAEHVAQETESRYLHALDAMLEGCQIIGFDWRYLYLNDAAARYGRQDKQDLLGHTMMERYPGIEETHLFDVLRACMEERTPHMEEFEFFYEDHSSAWFRTSVHPVPEGIFVLSLEITADKRAADAIRTLNTELEQRVIERTNLLEAKTRELETFTYSVSHDLKAPLRGIDGYSRLLLEDYWDRMNDEGRTFLQNIRQATEQMNQLIEDLLAYSRLERRELRMQPVQLKTVIEMIAAEFASEVQAAGTHITTAIPDVMVKTDSGGLSAIVRNLLDNALKFTRGVEQPQIDVGVRETENAYILWVRDNGIGFDMQYHDRIFEMFQRLQHAEDYAGTGVGLAIVRKAADRLGGRVWAESKRGQGATFYVEIPR